MHERGETLVYQVSQFYFDDIVYNFHITFDYFLSYSKIISKNLIVSFVRPFLTHKLFMVHYIHPQKTFGKKSVAV